jgi:chorismate mutase
VTAQLVELRHRIDNIDEEIVHLLAERFQATQRIGEYKRDHGLPAVDAERESHQLERISRLAEENGLDPSLARRILRLVLEEVVRNHNRFR